MTALVLGATALSAVVFAAVWLVSVRIKNYGLLDVAWSYGVVMLAPIYAFVGDGLPARKWLFAGIGAVWSLRLGTYILLRVLRHHPKEDVRYESLRRRWPGSGRFLLFFELQAGLVVVFSLPFLFAAHNTQPALTPWEIAGLALAALSLLGEAAADAQLKRFKRTAAPGAVCDVGLWRYSRHPNYFFESLFWWGIALAALSSPWGWVSVVCPLLMLYFLFQVTGIPLTEEYALKSKGEAYRAYQRTTSVFVPWFRKSVAG